MDTVVQPGRALQLEHRDVVGLVVADDLRRVGLAVADVGDLDRRGAVDHVVVGQHLTGRGQDHPGAGRLGALVAERGHDVDQARVDPGRDLASGKHGLRGSGGRAHRGRVQPADQSARGGARGERHGASDDQPALVVPARRWRRLGGEAVSSAITRSSRIHPAPQAKAAGPGPPG